MEGSDELIFSGFYKDMKLGIRYDLSGKSESDVAGVLHQVSNSIEKKAFEFSGIDTKAIDAYAKLQAVGLQAIVQFTETHSPGAIKAELQKACPKPELLLTAESYLLNVLLTNAGVQFKANVASTIKPTSEKVEDQIAFIASYKNWISIKKLGLESVQDYEVSGTLSSVNHTLVNKGYDFAGTKKDDALVESISKGKRKSFNNIGTALKELAVKPEAQNSYVVCKVCESIGIRPFASPEMLTAAYPDIKPPKQRGRKPKG